MKKEWRIILPIAVLVLALAVLSAPVSAQGAGAGCLSETKFNGTIKGDIYFEQQGWLEGSLPLPLTMSKSFTVPSGTIKVARVYTGVWGGSPGSGGYFNMTIGDHTSSNYKACDPCTQATDCGSFQTDRCDALNWSGNSENSNTDVCRDYVTGCNVHFITYNATEHITNGSSNTITVRTWEGADCERGNWDGSIYLISLLVVYEDSSKPNMTYWINEGCPYIEEDSACDGSDDHHNFSIYFNGTIPDDINTTKYWTLGFPHVANASTMELNGDDIGYPNHTESHDGYDVFSWWDGINTSWFNTTNHFYYNDTNPGYERVGVAVLKLSAETGPDFVVTDIDFPDVMRPDTNYTVNATIKNQGTVDATNQSNVTLYVNTTWNRTKSIQRLNASDSTTVSFTVNLSEGCYTFNVVADIDNDVSETDENNNATSEKYQVGYVVVVKSNSDFDDLINESKNGTLGTGNVSKTGDTYYLQNFTIENCAGNGITIENTNAKFVIMNCTIHDCSGGAAGVYFHNLSNGTINDSTVKDNTGKGIRIQKSTCVNITNNTVRNNTAYGIDVYPEILLPEHINDSKFVNISYNTLRNNSYGIELIGFNCTVRNNTIRNNTAYGIYVYGNYSNITYNDITYNDDYGIKVYTSSYNNYIYENNFTGNNAGSSGHQGSDSGTNYWNVTTKGNYWSDWKDNSGFPSNYTIDDGSNADERPKGLYDFLTGEEEDKWAYRYQVNAKPPDLTDNTVPSIEFLTDSDEYANIRVDDGTFQSEDTTIDGYFAAHRFNFSIAESVSSIAKINVTWNGIGCHDKNNLDDGAVLYIWNFSSQGYEQLADSGDTDAEVTLTGEVTTSISSYINSCNVTVLVVQKTAHDTGGQTYISHIETDYVRVVVAS